MQRRKSSKKFDKLYKINESHPDIKFLKELAVELDIKDGNGEYSVQKVYEPIIMTQRYIHKYLNSESNYYPLITPFGTFKPKLKALKYKALNKRNDLKGLRHEKYVDWYNNMVDYMKLKQKSYHKFIYDYIDCPDITIDDDIIKSEKETQCDAQYKKVLYKGVRVMNGKHKGKEGIVIGRALVSKCMVKVIDEPKPIIVLLNNVILLTDIPTT